MTRPDPERAQRDALLSSIASQIADGKPVDLIAVRKILQIEATHPDWPRPWDYASVVLPALPPEPPAPPAPPPPPPPVVWTTPPPPPSVTVPTDATALLAPVSPAAQLAAARPVQEGLRVPLEVDENMERLQTEVLTVWASRYIVFQAGGRLVEVQIDKKSRLAGPDETDFTRLVAVGRERARAIASRECLFTQIKTKKDGTSESVAVYPPEWLGGMLISRPEIAQIPRIDALSATPTLRKDGALISEKGYDKSTGIYLTGELKVDVPEAPTLEMARAAGLDLLDLISDFDFTSEAAKSAWMATCATTLCRHTFYGPAPMLIITANRRSCGKTKLADLVSLIAKGCTAPRMIYSRDEIEMDKRISSLAAAGEQFVLFDNVTGTFASAALDAALTGSSYRGRKLCTLELTPALTMKITWVATGNGMVLGADVARRSLMIRLETDCEFPELRKGPREGVEWKYPRILEHTLANRSRYVSDILTLIKAYICAGCPRQDVVPMGSFEAWSSVIRSAIIWAGFADPCATNQDAREADADDEALRGMIECWPVPDGVEITAPQLVEFAQIDIMPQAMSNDEARSSRIDWRNALLEWQPAKGKGDLPTARDLGYALRKVNKTIVGKYRIESGTRTKTGTPWRRIQIDTSQPAPPPPPATMVPPAPPVGIPSLQIIR